MAKIKDLGITIRPATMQSRGDGFGYHAIYDRGMECEEDTGSETCTNATCGDDDDDDQGKPPRPKPKKYHAFNADLIAQFKQQLDSHLGA